MIDVCTCYVALGGDTKNVVYRGPTNPVTWPEIGVLQALHGENAVYGIEVIDTATYTRTTEKDRLKGIYEEGIVEMLYPGRMPSMELRMPGSDDPAVKAEKAEAKRKDKTYADIVHDAAMAKLPPDQKD